MHRLTRRLPLLVLLALAASALLAAACSSDSETPARAMQLSMQDVAYTTGALTAMKGEHIRIEVDNRGQLTHDFTIDRMPMRGLHMMGGGGGDHQHMNSDHAMHLALDMGASCSLEFTPTEPGAYEFYCTVPGHRDAGMHGTLTVQ